MNHVVRTTTLALAAVMLHACASQPPGRPPANILNVSALPAGSPGLDHYIAWIPFDQAQTASVAEAMTHISLQKTREQVSHDLCNDALITAGNMIEKHGPVAARTPASMGGQPAWYYRISQQPGLAGCNGRHDSYLYQALQARLPRWISISPAEPVGDQSMELQNELLVSGDR